MNVLVNGEPYTIKVMEEEAANGIFSIKSDHVFKILSDSDEGLSESWSLANDSDAEQSEASIGAGELIGSKNISTRKKDEEDVEAGASVLKKAVFREEQSPYRWMTERQISNKDYTSALNDIPFNAEGSQGKQQVTSDGKIQLDCINNHEKFKDDSEIVLESQDSQASQKKKMQWRWERRWALEPYNPVESSGTQANNSNRPHNQPTLRTDDSESTNAVVDTNADKAGLIQSTNGNKKKGIPPVDAHEEKQSKTASTDCHFARQGRNF
ncbi:hypothetical protein SLA2020_193470 [Shorea laevis]